MMNGKTVGINNTNAEGRLILRDGLHYAEKFYRPDVLIDTASLTGSCRQALGCGYSGLTSRDDRLNGKLIMACKRVDFITNYEVDNNGVA